MKKMFTQKDRRIANQAAMIRNRNEIIERQKEKIAELESKIMQVRIMASMNNYNNPNVYLRKIKELVRRLIITNSNIQKFSYKIKLLI